MELLHDLEGDLVLGLEDVLDDAIVDVREDVITVLSVDKLGGDPHPVPGLPHASLEDVGDVQLGPHLPDVDLLALERERGRSGRDPEPVHPGQHVDDLLGDAVGEKRVVRVGAHVDEGEHRDALLLGIGPDRLGSPTGREGALLKNGHWPVLVGHEEDLHGPGHVLQLEMPEGADEHAWLILQVVVDPFGTSTSPGGQRPWTREATLTPSP